METFTFSIIIPVYNAEPYLKECIDSILNQCFSDFEIILVDDGSTDFSLSIIDDYKKINDRISVLQQEHHNAGVARNNGLDIAKGEYLLFIDADDFVSNDLFYELSKAIINKPDLVIYGAKEYYNPNKKTRYLDESLVLSNCPGRSPFSPIEMNEYIFNSFQNWPWNKAYKKSFILDKNIRFQDVNRSNDVLFVNLALSLSKTIVIINKPLIIHRIGHCTNMQANNSKEPLAFWDAFSTTYNSLKKSLGTDFQLYERSFFSCILPAIKDYLLSTRNDLSAYDLVKKHIVENGESDFGFLKHNKDYYYDQESYVWYVNLLNGIDKYLPINSQHASAKPSLSSTFNLFFRKVAGLFVSIKDNGFDYSFKRLLYHFHLAGDNDPQRTRDKTINRY